MNLAEATVRSKILVVEDEALIAEELADRLRRLSYDVTGIADTGRKAIAEVRAHPPDLVLMDIRLKGAEDGIFVAGEITKEFDVPIIYLTAHSDQATLARARETAPHGYILKPFQERDLVTIDMTLHRHRLEKRLRSSEVRYSTTLASIGDGVVAADLRGNVTFINAVASALTLWSEADAHGTSLTSVMPIVHEVSRLPLENPGIKALRLRAKSELEEPVQLRAKNGELIPIDYSAAPVMEKGEILAGVVIAFRDVRQRRLAENSLREAEAQLRQAQKMEAVGRLAGGIAHDFNNILTIISTSSEALSTLECIDDEAREIIQEIGTATERAAALTRQLLAFSRKQVLQPKILDLNEHLRESHRMLLRLIGAHIRFDLELDPAAHPIRFDPSQLEQVIMNLVLNARDAMPHGGRLLISTSNCDRPREAAQASTEKYLCLSVTDTGYGMPHDVIARAFEPFFTTKEKGKGTGLGLATVHGIVTQSHGVVTLESEVGKGSTFRVFLPEADELAAVSSRTVRKLTGGKERLLLVDDEDGVRDIIATTLKRQGYRVTTARDGREALALFRIHSAEIDMLVTDVVMPHLGGRELAEEILKLRPELPVLFMSGYTDDSLVRHGVEGGQANFLQKPFRGTELSAKVREILDSSPSLRPQPESEEE